MGRRKCTPKQLAALRRGREKLAHKRSKKRTNGLWDKILEFNKTASSKISRDANLSRIKIVMTFYILLKWEDANVLQSN